MELPNLLLIVMLYKDEGIIIKQRDLGEADKIVTFILKSRGRVDTVAKSARKPKSRKATTLDLGNILKVSIAETKGLDILTETKLIDGPQYIRKNLKHVYALYLILEITDKLNQEESQGVDIYHLLKESILATETNTENFQTILYIYIQKILSVSGFTVEEKEHYKANKNLQRMYKILRFWKENSLNEALRLSLRQEDYRYIESHLIKEVEKIIEKKLKSYELWKKVSN